MINIFHDKQQQIESQLKKVIDNWQKQESREHLKERLCEIKNFILEQGINVDKYKSYAHVISLPWG